MHTEGSAASLRPMRLADMNTAIELLMTTSAYDIRHRLRDRLRAVTQGESGLAVVAELEGRVVGAGKVTTEPAFPGTMSALVAVDPAARGRGIGTALANAVTDQSTPVAGITTFTCALRDDLAPGRAFAERFGFTLANHDTGLRLDLTGPAAALSDEADRAAHRARVRTRVADLTTDESVIMDCVRRSLAGLPVPFGDSQEVDSAQTRALIPDGALIILAEDVEEPGPPCGITILAPQPDSTEWHVEYTGVDPGRRAQGVAEALKNASHLGAFRSGARSVTTFNDDSNEPILRLNRKMGMTPSVGYWGLVRPLS